MSIRCLAVIALGLLAAGCQSLVPEKLREEPPPLADMEEPVPLLAEPDDEAARRELPAGCFSGVVLGTGWTSLEDSSGGVAVKEVIENSPADAAGIAPGDILLVAVPGEGEEVDLDFPSRWREIELGSPPGTEVRVILDRAGRERSTTLTLIPRVRPAERGEAERYREEDRVGVVLRTATEVEARAAGLGPGGGAVVVGLSHRSPWRRAGVLYEDLLVSVGQTPVDHPQVVLDAIREAGDELTVTLVREGERIRLETRLTEREGEVDRVNIPPLFDYEDDRGQVELSILLGLVRHERTSAAWEWRILWLWRIRGGEADRLEEVDE